jgi:hypothetical protein
MCCTHFKTLQPCCDILRFFRKGFYIPFCYYFTVMLLKHEYYLYSVCCYQYISFLWNYSFLYMLRHRNFMSTSLTIQDVFHSLRLRVVSFLSFKCTTVMHYFITFSVSLFLKLLLSFLYEREEPFFCKMHKDIVYSARMSQNSEHKNEHEIGFSIFYV